MTSRRCSSRAARVSRAVRSERSFQVFAALLIIATLAFALPLSGAGLERLATPPETLAEVVVSWQTADAHRAQVISVDWATYAFVIPAAGSLPGANNTYFRSDVTLSNRRNVPQIISVAWIARGVNNGSAPVQSFSLPANTAVIEHDFVARILARSGLGSIVVIARDYAGGIDTAAQIDGFSRIWTNQPNASGTVSQTFPAIDVEDNLATSYGYGLRQDEQYRTNVGFVNLYGTTQTFSVSVVGLSRSASFSTTVQPYSMEQVPLPAGNFGDLYVRVTSGANFNWWTAYGTSVDNRTGDGWVSHVH